MPVEKVTLGCLDPEKVVVSAEAIELAIGLVATCKFRPTEVARVDSDLLPSPGNPVSLAEFKKIFKMLGVGVYSFWEKYPNDLGKVEITSALAGDEHLQVVKDWLDLTATHRDSRDGEYITDLALAGQLNNDTGKWVVDWPDTKEKSFSLEVLDPPEGVDKGNFVVVHLGQIAGVVSMKEAKEAFEFLKTQTKVSKLLEKNDGKRIPLPQLLKKREGT